MDFHLSSITSPVARYGSSESSPVPPRAVLVRGNTGQYAVCRRAAVVSRTEAVTTRPPDAPPPSRHRRAAAESLMRVVARHALRRL